MFPDYALSVGINCYPGLTPLMGAEADAQAFHAWVTQTGGVAPGGRQTDPVLPVSRASGARQRASGQSGNLGFL